ncbi:hypothetical protein FF36_05833 [Frankia torreyi]|uniref:Uncharacterized protein n=1 Tax=Frankia torreyi TaxID=1856 RepID=A0A0D8B715_9ACTN|nr:MULTISPECIES: hypothetical protein [Frankia]KJE19890.1 hypothetical protein FF36_05833 [Frankia torreyi]KQC35468.1 hypothetical protein UK82_26205 [Frankia sp. ACN1ag]KQM03579.1 hypothetical protein FF86_103845 [Frankia sp. CpI1-P]
MTAESAPSFAVSNVRSEPRVGLDGPNHLVTVTVGAWSGRRFLFCLGTVATLGIRLGVSTCGGSRQLVYGFLKVMGVRAMSSAGWGKRGPAV